MVGKIRGNEAGCIYAVLCIIVSVIISKEYERMPVLAVYTIFNLVLNIVNCYKIMSYSFKYSPLIGAPSFLNIHKSMNMQIKDLKYKIDFIPYNPTNPETLISLIFNQNVNGDLRIRMSNENQNSNLNPNTNENINININDNKLKKKISLLNEFLADYNRDFNLYTNNCYTFCYNLKYFIDDEINLTNI